MLWNGCKENIWGHRDWGWQDALGDRTWGWAHYNDLLPSIVTELDPTRPYSPGGAYSMSPQLPPNDPSHGTMHVWDVRNERDYTAYRDYVPRFAAEFGFQGPPAWATLTRAIHDEPLTRTRPARWRIRKPRTATPNFPAASRGSWPRRPHSTTGTGPPRSSARRWSGTVALTRRSFDGEVIAQTRLPIDIEAHGHRTVRVPDHVAAADDPTRELLLAEIGATRAWWPFVEDVAAALPATQFDTHLDAIDGGYCLTVTAGTLLRDLALLADRVAPDAIVDDMLITLLPGESTTFEIHTAVVLTHDQLVDPLVLRSANQLAHITVERLRHFSESGSGCIFSRP